MTKLDIKFGDKIKFNAQLRRSVRNEYTENKYTGRQESREVKFWETQPMEGEGIFLGTRTLFDGVRDWTGDAGCVFFPKKHFIAAVICEGPRKNPIYVPLEALAAR